MVKAEIKNLLKDLNPSEAMQILDSLEREIGRANSIRINSLQMNSRNKLKVDPERPDLLSMK